MDENKKQVNDIGIMQGRLVPPTNGKIQCFPRENWADEFIHAKMAKLSFIEWIFDRHGEDVNPLSTVSGIERMRELKEAQGVDIRSLCADYFMDFPFIGASESERRERIQKLEWLLQQAALLDIGRIVIPFVDQSSLRTEADLVVGAQALHAVLPTAARLGVEIHLETDLAPAPFATFLSRFPVSSVKVNYDSGNSASLGYCPSDEFAAYGERVGSVHIKDRLRGGTTVPLGTGSTDFSDLFSCLRWVGYNGDYVLQVARGADQDEVSWATENRKFVESYLPRSLSGLLPAR